MDPQGVGQQNTNQEDLIDRQFTPDTIPPPGRSFRIFIIIGVVLLIIIIVTGVIFILTRGRAGDSESKNGASTLSPAPTPTFYEMLSLDLQGLEAKVNEIGNDLRELETNLAYESVNFSDVLTPPPVNTAEWEAQKTEIAKSRAELEIDRRIAVLDKLTPKVEASERLSQAQKSQLSAEIGAEIASLSSLKARIISHLDFASLTADINTLSDSFKNYQVLVPKVLIASIADKINVQGDSFTIVADKMAIKIDEFFSKEKDVSEVQKTLGHMLFVLGDAANKSEAAVVSVLPLLPIDYPKNKSVLLDAKGKIGTSHKNLTLAISDGKNIVNAFVGIESGKQPSRNFFQLFPIFRF